MIRPQGIEEVAGFCALAFGCESLFFGACTTFLLDDFSGLARLLSILACVGFLVAYVRGGRLVQALVTCLLVPTSLLIWQAAPQLSFIAYQ